MIVFRVLLAVIVRDNEKFIQFECAHQTVEGLVAALETGKLVQGKQVFTRRGKEKGIWYVVGRRSMALDRRIVGAITLPHEDAVYVEGLPPAAAA